MKSLREIWEEQAQEWSELVRSDGDVPYGWNAPAFLELLPPPGRLTVDVGCGEGRFTRELAAVGHVVVGVDASTTLVRLARDADPTGDYRLADAATLPFDDASADLVVAFMSLHDIDDCATTVREAARVLRSQGRFCFAIVHPIASAGEFAQDESFVVTDSYLSRFRRRYPLGAAEIESLHRPLEDYFRALEEAGLVVEAIRELPTRRRVPGRIPMFLHVRALRR